MPLLMLFLSIPVPWTPEAEEAFIRVEKELSAAALLVHPRIVAEIRIVSDSFDSGMGAALEQLSLTGISEPLAFFSKKLSPSRKYSAYDRERTAIYEAVNNSPRQTRQLSLIAQYTT